MVRGVGLDGLTVVLESWWSWVGSQGVSRREGREMAEHPISSL